MANNNHRGEAATDGVRRLLPRALLASVAVAVALATTACHSETPVHNSPAEPTADQGDPNADHRFVGMWVTGDGRIRQELFPDGRYSEARGQRENAFTGRYQVVGNYIKYWDDSGFTADGTFATDNELHHGGMTFYRQVP